MVAGKRTHVSARSVCDLADRRADLWGNLSAAGSSDPDGNQLQFHWVAYNEAGHFASFLAGQVTQASISGAQNQAATVTANLPGVAHIILAVTDNGTANPTSYRRVILNVTPPQ